MKNSNNNLEQEKWINIVSGMVLVFAVIIIIMNITGKSDSHGANVGNEAEAAANGISEELKLADGVTLGEQQSDMTTPGDTQPDTAEEISTQEASAELNTSVADSTTTPAIDIASKEYNNVTSGKLEETKYVDSEYFENTMFLGDSRTVALKNHGFINEANTFAVNGINHITFLTQQFTDTVTGVTGDIFSIVSARKPERIYVALGVNGVAFIDKATFLSKYKELIDGIMAASPESTIIIQSILPVNEETYTGGNKNLNNVNIDSMNGELLKLAESEGIFYLDIAGGMKDGNNKLLSQYDSGDGLHFSFTGYSVVYDGICKHGVD